MFTVLIVGATTERARSIREAVIATGQLDLLREVESYPDTYSLARLAGGYDPDLWLVDLSDAGRSLDCVARIRESHPDSAIVGIRGESDLRLTPDETRIAAVVRYPPPVEDLLRAADDALHRAKGGIIERMFVFLPAKGGSGASTVALNTAAAMAGELGKNPLLLDGDLRSGALSLMLNLAPEHSLQEVLQSIVELDSFRWNNSVVRVHGFDLLASSRNPVAIVPSWTEYFLLLNFVRLRYDALLVDLPELVNPATVEIVRRAEMVLLVCTPEVLPLKLAQQRAVELRKWGVADSRVKIVLNRWVSSEMAPAHVEEFLRHPVMKVLPNDYRTVRQSIVAGSGVPAECKLGKAFAELAAEMIGAPPRPQSALGKFKGLLRRG
ncbi:MAG: AAA family ATPase [Acidobacteria bacterium]|nr:AAA family ATPase [Acidobacteriota bacterium]